MSDYFWRKCGAVFGLILGFVVFLPSLGSSDEIASARAQRVGHATINKVLLNGLRGGRDNPVAVRAGSPVTIELGFHSDSSGWCPKCSNQIVIGYAFRRAKRVERLPGGKCVFSSSGQQRRKNITFRMLAPMHPGRYEVIISAPQAYNCTKALRWRARTETIAELRVK